MRREEEKKPAERESAMRKPRHESEESRRPVGQGTVRRVQIDDRPRQIMNEKEREEMRKGGGENRGRGKGFSPLWKGGSKSWNRTGGSKGKQKGNGKVKMRSGTPIPR